MSDANGLYYMRARYYSPELKRFINADIVSGNIANSITLNRYAYANGNPVTNSDPLGLEAERMHIEAENLELPNRKLTRRELQRLHLQAKQNWVKTKNQTYISPLDPSTIPFNKAADEQELLNNLLKLHDLLTGVLSIGSSTVSNTYRVSIGLFANREYQINHRFHDYDDDYIHHQYNENGEYVYGLALSRLNGCEPIAIYNALYYHGVKTTLEDVMYQMQTSYTMVAGGFFGSNPYSLGRTLNRYGMKYEKVTLDQMDKEGIYILSFWNEENVWGQLHTVAVTYDGNQYVAYNYGGTSNQFNPNDYMNRFVCGYYVDGKR